MLSKINSICEMRLIKMQILINNGEVIRPEFGRWNSYTQQACLSSFFFFFCSRKASIQIHVITYFVFTEEKEIYKQL